MTLIITALVSFVAGAVSYRLFWPKAKAEALAEIKKVV
jgi:hypothetical protein